jgi:hypothetical protein
VRVEHTVGASAAQFFEREVSAATDAKNLEDLFFASPKADDIGRASVHLFTAHGVLRIGRMNGAGAIIEYFRRGDGNFQSMRRSSPV